MGEDPATDEPAVDGELPAHVDPVHDVVAEDQGHGVGADEVVTDQERLRDPIRTRLYGVFQAQARLDAATEQA